MRRKLNVKLLRKNLDINQEEISEKFGLSRTAWSNYERQNSFPESLLREIEAAYSSEIKKLGDKVTDEPIDYNTVLSLRSRVAELETTIRQQESIIRNQMSMLELQNQTIKMLQSQL